jgi:hypothetical protein
VTKRLHELIDSGGNQNQINERVAGIMDGIMKDIERIGSDHEKRLRFMERTINYALGTIGGISAILYLIKVLKG